MQMRNQKAEDSMIDIRYLYTFKTIVEEGGFTKAAAKLNYTQSTITFHVSQLEKELNVQLFEKVGRNMVLTKAGTAFIPYVEEVLESLDKMNTFQEDMNECKGELRIGAPESVLCFLLPPLLKKYRQRAPKVRLNLTSINSTNIVRALEKDDLDVGIFYGQEKNIGLSKLETHPFGTFPLEMCASPRVAADNPDFGDPEKDYTRITPIIQPSSGGIRHHFNHFMKERGVTWASPIIIRSTQTIINLTRNDMGVCYLPDFAVREFIEKGELVNLLPHMKGEDISVIYGTRARKWKNQAMKVFLEEMEGYRAFLRK